MSRASSGLLALALLGCPPVPTSVAMGESIPLAPGQSASLAGGPVLTFVRVVSDSRCPKDAVCVRAGEVVVEIAVSGQEKGTMRPGETIRCGRLEVALVAVEPYPSLSEPIEPSAYRATFQLGESDG